MDQRSYDAAQQGLLTCLLEQDQDHERRLVIFLNGLRNDPSWTEANVDQVEDKLREMLVDMREQEKPTTLLFRVRPHLKG